MGARSILTFGSGQHTVYKRGGRMSEIFENVTHSVISLTTSCDDPLNGMPLIDGW